MNDLPELRFLPEFRCWPTWTSMPGGGEDNPDPRDLGLSDELADDIVRWSENYDALFDPNDFTRDIFASRADEEAFAAQTRVLAQKLAGELRGRFEVRYLWPGEDWESL